MEHAALQSVVEAICLLPIDYLAKNVSPLELAENSGYRGFYLAITRQEIVRYLEDHPDLLGDWYVYSDNKRCVGWYFDLWANKIGYLPETVRQEMRFDNAFEACAAFIQLELNSILGLDRTDEAI